MDFDSDIDTHDDYEAAMSLPHSLLNSDSLTSLNLTMQSTKIEFPTSIWLPRLQTLKFTAQSSEFEFPTSGIQFLLSHKKIEVDKLSIFYNLTLLEGIQFLLGLKKIEVDKLPIFYNLTHLELAVRGGRGGVILLVCILQKSPHLQSLKSRIFIGVVMGKVCL
ncbi:F-box protein [Corchorus olitorius]|uniref:F-box protein n=1 Tax=Corchorus olitorius TaxID=93759 RepID=A0A1R3HHA0_9ROSI|nr:F-box protein [Corchorus olitorius]